jgi:hypothetical protein
VDIGVKQLLRKSTKMMNRPGASNAVTFSPLVNQCAETHKIIGFGKVLARFGKPTTNSFFSIEFIEITCLKPYEHFSVLEKKRCFK